MDSRENAFIINGAVEKIVAIAQGTPINHLVLAEMLQTEPKTNRYYTLISKLKIELENEYGLFMKNINRVGYEVVLPGDEIHLCMGKVRIGLNMIVRGAEGARHINFNKITDNKKRVLAVQSVQKINNLCGMIKMGGMIEQKAVSS